MPRSPPSPTATPMLSRAHGIPLVLLLALVSCATLAGLGRTRLRVLPEGTPDKQAIVTSTGNIRLLEFYGAVVERGEEFYAQHSGGVDLRDNLDYVVDASTPVLVQARYYGSEFDSNRDTGRTTMTTTTSDGQDLRIDAKPGHRYEIRVHHCGAGAFFAAYDVADETIASKPESCDALGKELAQNAADKAALRRLAAAWPGHMKETDAFGYFCARCHAADGSGRPRLVPHWRTDDSPELRARAVPDLSSAAWQGSVTDEQITGRFLKTHLAYTKPNTTKFSAEDLSVNVVRALGAH